MAFLRQGRKRRQMEAVRTRMALREEAVVRVSPLRQLRVTRVDLDYLDCLTELTVPSQPPPLVAAVHGGDERDVTAVVSGHQLTDEATALQAGTPTTAGGTVTPPGGQYERGAAVTLTAVPDEGYAFDGWTIDGAAVAENPTVVHIQHLTVAAAAFVVEP